MGFASACVWDVQLDHGYGPEGISEVSFVGTLQLFLPNSVVIATRNAPTERWIYQEFCAFADVHCEDPSGERGQTHSQDCLRKCAATAAAQRQGILGRGASGDELFMAWDEDGKRGHVCEAHYRLDGMLRANVD